jgi:hypothetical protein
VPNVADWYGRRPLVRNYEWAEFLDWKIRSGLFETREFTLEWGEILVSEMPSVGKL